jgi:hypothetical protein
MTKRVNPKMQAPSRHRIGLRWPGQVVVLAAVLGGTAPVYGQAALVHRNVNLRQDASTFYPPITLVPAGTTLTLLSLDPIEEFYHVRTPEGREGWVWANNIDPSAETLSVPMSTNLPGELPQLAVCNIPDTQKSRWAQKTRDIPSPGYHEIQNTVEEMLNWVVPTNLPTSARTSDDPIGLEKFSRVYALTGFVRVVEQESDCDFYVEVAASRDADAPRVIVKVPLKYVDTQRMVMQLVGMHDAQTTRMISAANAPQLTFINYAFLDQWHQTNPPTQEGALHGPKGVVQTLWELHPVWEVR